MEGKPRKGKGIRDIDCPLDGDCLLFAAKKHWNSFNCEGCDYMSRPEELMAVTEKPVNTRICEECGEKPTLSPKSPYCASCSALRSHKARREKMKVVEPQKKTSKTPKKKGASIGKAKKEKPSLHRDKTAITIEFGRHASILREVEKIADEEFRPVELQVIYMLKTSLSNSGKITQISSK